MAKLPTFEVYKEGHGRTVVDARCWDAYQKRGFKPVDKKVMKLALKGKFSDGTTVDGRNIAEIEKKQIAEIKRQQREKKAKKAQLRKTADLKPEDEKDVQIPVEDPKAPQKASGEVSDRAIGLALEVKTLKNKELAGFCTRNNINLDLTDYNNVKERKVAIVEFIRDNF